MIERLMRVNVRRELGVSSESVADVLGTRGWLTGEHDERRLSLASENVSAAGLYRSARRKDRLQAGSNERRPVTAGADVYIQHRPVAQRHPAANEADGRTFTDAVTERWSGEGLLAQRRELSTHVQCSPSSDRTRPQPGSLARSSAVAF